MTIIAKDPGVRLADGAILFARITIPAEELAPGPTGYRVKVVDFDATAGRLYRPLAVYQAKDGTLDDPFRAPDAASDADDVGALTAAHQAALLADPNFHAQNAYAIVMRILARFEFALGRRVEWGFNGHQLHVAPHAFLDANAFYSNEDSGLMFGYFRGKSGAMVFTSLSHDIVAHETTHALLDGLRDRFTEPSSPDQAAFHEAFADIVALLSVFALPEVVAAILGAPPRRKDEGGRIRSIDPARLTLKEMQNSILSGIAAQLGLELDGLRGRALRQSVLLEPDAGLLASAEFAEPHRRGEVLVAAMMRTALTLWRNRIETLGTLADGGYNLDRVIEEGAKVADHLLTMAIRAIDYCPPTDIDFGVYLAAFLTADAELMPDDNRFSYRAVLRATFAAYGIVTPPGQRCADDGSWRAFDAALPVNYARSHFESMLRDKDEVFRFIWDNRGVLGIGTRATIKVGAVRPSIRQSPDGFFVRETVCTYVQIANIFGSEVKSVLGVERPDELETTRSITAFGGGTIIFDQYGRIKYHVAHPLKDGDRQARRLASLGEIETAETAFDRRNRFALLHAARAGS